MTALFFAPSPLCLAFDCRGLGCSLLSLWRHAQQVPHDFSFSVRYAGKRIVSICIAHETILAQRGS
jgi:hypothetical protein